MKHANFKIYVIMSLGILTSCATTKSIYKKEVKDRFNQPIQKPSIIKTEDLKTLPVPVARYLEYCGWVGKEKPLNFHVKMNGKFSLKQGKWSKVNVDQYSWLDRPVRLFHISNWIVGGRHRMDNRGAFMLIKLFGRFKIVDVSGPEMNQAELVTYLNDICLIAPAALIDAPIIWETIDDLTTKATISELGNTISATLYFNEKGELINFISNDRFATPDGKKSQNFPWSTPIGEYIETGGIKLPGYAEAIWHYPEGDQCYAKFFVKEVRYNLITMNGK
jgi:hypothetical protein